MRRLAAAFLVVLLVPAFAGCLDSSGGSAASAAGDDAGPVVAPEIPAVSARATLDDLREFSEAFPYRQSGQATHLASRDWLANAFEDAGLDVLRQAFPASVRGLPGASYDGENVIGIKWGEDRDNWVVIGAHYDITEGAVHGAYDDGGGTVMTVKLAEAYANVATNRTLAFVLFDQEERGLVGSRFFVESVLDGSFEHPVTVDAMIDLDMVGITFPHPADLVVWENSPTLEEWIVNLTAAVGVPQGQLQFREPFGGVSDGAAFIQAGIATAYFWSNWDEVVLADGTAVPGSYPWWHQADTYDTMVLMAGDEDTLEAGFRTVLDVVSPLIARAASPEFVPDPEPAE